MEWRGPTPRPAALPQRGAVRPKGGTLPDQYTWRSGLPSGRLRFRGAGAAAETEAVTVPQNKDLKRLVRARMAETSENYTQALTALLGEARLDPLPDGWHMAGSRPADYDAGLLPPASGYDGKRVIRLRFRAPDPPAGFGTVMQSIDAARYRGRRVRFSAMLLCQEVSVWAGTWLPAERARRAGLRRGGRSGRAAGNLDGPGRCPQAGPAHAAPSARAPSSAAMAGES